MTQSASHRVRHPSFQPHRPLCVHRPRSPSLPWSHALHSVYGLGLHTDLKGTLPPAPRPPGGSRRRHTLQVTSWAVLSLLQMRFSTVSSGRILFLYISRRPAVQPSSVCPDQFHPASDRDPRWEDPCHVHLWLWWHEQSRLAAPPARRLPAIVGPLPLHGSDRYYDH